jgi:hypothetical protein
MGSTLKRMRGWFDELPEVVGWLVLGSSTGLVATGKIGGAEYAGLAALAVVTLVGARRYRGVKVGPISVDAAPSCPLPPASPAPSDDDEVVG